MDIVIQNGKINFTEMKRIQEIKETADIIKKDYSNFDKNICGPYYDIQDAHLHVWRRAEQIQNFRGPQDQKRFQFEKKAYDKNHKFCSICHCKLISNPAFAQLKKPIIPKKSNPEQITNKKNQDYSNKWINFYDCYKIPKNNLLKVKLQKEKIINNYYKMVYKMLNKPIMYPISSKETKLIWPWDLTNYQKFKLKNPNYKENIIFITPKDITENYVIIE